MYCVTSPTKDERYRAPPPTPPGYQGLALGDLGLTDGVVSGPGGLSPRPPHLRPPDYSVALQRSKLLQSPGATGGLPEARRLAANRLLQHQEERSSGPTQGHSRPASICLPAQDLADSDDGTRYSRFSRPRQLCLSGHTCSPFSLVCNQVFYFTCFLTVTLILISPWLIMKHFDASKTQTLAENQINPSISRSQHHMGTGRQQSLALAFVHFVIVFWS